MTDLASMKNKLYSRYSTLSPATRKAPTPTQRHDIDPVAVTITGGRDTTFDGDMWRVPKRRRSCGRWRRPSRAAGSRWPEACAAPGRSGPSCRPS